METWTFLLKVWHHGHSKNHTLSSIENKGGENNCHFVCWIYRCTC